MARYFTQYWRNETWAFNQEVSAEGDLLDHTAGNLFTQRGVQSGDVIYVVTFLSGKLYLCGRMVVRKICDAREAAKLLGCQTQDLWEASEHVIASEATPMRFSLAVPITVTARLVFVSGRKSRNLRYKAAGILSEQTIRGVRELDRESAGMLDELLPELQPVVLPRVG